jgi:hypothetical protein
MQENTAARLASIEAGLGRLRRDQSGYRSA